MSLFPAYLPIVSSKARKDRREKDSTFIFLHYFVYCYSFQKYRQYEKSSENCHPWYRKFPSNGSFSAKGAKGY